MNKALPVIAFGIGLICLGFYWHFFNDVYTMDIVRYKVTNYTLFGVHYTTDKYQEFMEMIWYLLPWISVVVGVLLLIYAGSSSTSSGGGRPE